MDDRVELLFRASHDPSEVFAVLSARYTVLVDPGTSQQWTCLDTADWRLHRAGMTLRDRRRGRTGELVLTAPGGVRISTPARVGTWPRRMDLVPASPVRDRVDSTVGIRALLPMAAVDSRSTRLRLLDDLDKTRVRVQIDQQRLLDGTHAPLPLRVVLTPLRGYERDARRCARLLTESLATVEGQSDAVAAALTAAGRRPQTERDLTPVEPYDPGAPAAPTIAAALLSYVDLVDANLPGVRDDLDPEFLHDLRTAVAAIRSILTLAGGVLAGASVDRFSADFAWLDEVTAPLRELDVFLLELLGHGRLDVSGLDATVDPLRRYVVRQRSRALRTLRAALSTHRLASLAGDFRRLLERVAASEETAPATGTALAACVPVAYAMVVADRSVPSIESTVALRERCEPLRYLLDAFGPAFEPAASAAVLGGLRKLQDRVDDVLSATAQLRHLTDAAASLAASGTAVESLLAVGALHDRVGRYETDARRELYARLARFGGRRMAAQVEVLLPARNDAALQQSSL